MAGEIIPTEEQLREIEERPEGAPDGFEESEDE